jgi:L-lactate dehydrogenase complex protein LldG
MNSENARETFLGNVRDALASATRPAAGGRPPPRIRAGERPMPTDLADNFCKGFTDAGGRASLVADDASALSQIVQIIENVGAKRILLGQGPVLGRLGVGERLTELGHGGVTGTVTLTASDARDVFFGSDLSISGVDYLIAETGTVVVTARSEEPRSLSLLAPVHVAVADESQLLPDLFDLFDESVWQGQDGVPSCVTLITGPSKTGDIELRLVTGVHGPGEIHVIVIRRERK